MGFSGTSRNWGRFVEGLLGSLTDLGVIRREPSGASTTAVKVLRWAAVVGVLVVLYFFGRFSGAF